MNILIVTNSYPHPFWNYYPGKFVQVHARAIADVLWKEMGYVDVLCLQPYLNSRFPEFDYRDGKNIDVHFRYYPKRGFRHVQEMKLIKQFIEYHGRPDLIHCHNSYPCGMALADAKLGIPMVLTLHDNPPDLSCPGQLQYIMNNFERIIRVTPIDVDELRKLNRNTVFIPNGYDYRDYHYDRKRIDSWSARRIELISVGGLGPRKAFDRVIRVLPELLEIHKFRYSILGYPSLVKKYPRYLHKLVRDLDLKDHVRFLNGYRMPTSAMNDVYNQSHLCLIPSERETLSMVALEAIATGCPVITFKNGGTETCIENRNGVVVWEQDEKLFRNAILEATYRPWEYDEIAKSSEKYEMHGISERVYDVYSHII